MKGTKLIVGLCLAGVMLTAGISAQPAAATTFGTTAFTCSASAPTKTFKTEHCKSSDGAGTAFGHVAIAENTKTEIEATNTTTGTETSPITLHSTQAGIAEELLFKTVHLGFVGSLENKKDPSGEHWLHVIFKLKLTFGEVTKPAGKGCKVKGSEIESRELTGSSTAAGHFFIFKPTEGNVIAEFEIEGCTGSKAIESLNGLYTLSGSVKGAPNGATLAFASVETTAQETLFLREQKAGMAGVYTIKARANSSQAYTPISPTTVETP